MLRLIKERDRLERGISISIAQEQICKQNVGQQVDFTKLQKAEYKRWLKANQMDGLKYFKAEKEMIKKRVSIDA